MLEYGEIQRDAKGVLSEICQFLKVNPDQIDVDDRRVNSSFQNRERVGPPHSTRYWLDLLAKDEWQTLYGGVMGPDYSRMDVIISWLLLLPGLVAFLCYAPRPAQWFSYMAKIVGITFLHRCKQQS